MNSSLAAKLAVVGLSLAMPAIAEQFLVYVGTYTGPKSEGIYVCRFDNVTGQVGDLSLAAKSESPAFLAVHPNGQFVYAANEVDKWNGKPGGYVTAFKVNAATGRLVELNQQSTVGDGPCHLNVDGTGKNVVVVNYGGGSVAVLPVEVGGTLKPHSAFVQHTGSSVNASRQKEAHAHSVNFSPDNRFAFVCDLGTDRVNVYALDSEKGSLTARPDLDVVMPPGSGPRHFAFAPKGARAFVISELLQTVTSFSYAADAGKLTALDVLSTLPDAKPVAGNSTAEVRVHPNGKFVYGSNRGHDSIAVFSVNDQGKLTLVQNAPAGGRTPRNFNLDPSGRFMFVGHQGSDSFAVFKVDDQTGKLTPTGKTFSVGAPVCFRFVALK